jgi:aspartate aminotransferase
MSVYTPSANVIQLRESATIAVSQHARRLRAAGREVLDLGAGEPDFDTPAFIRQAAADAVAAGATRYTAVEGILPLREAIAKQANEAYAGPGPVGVEDVVVTTGSKQSLFNACFVLFGTGDEVLIPTPSWTSYYEMVALARATAVEVRGERARNLKVTPAQLEAAATSRTRGVMLNTPTNPTGAVYSADELRAILDLADARGWWVVSDEIYRRIAYEHRAPSVLEVAKNRDRLVVVNGVAKAYAMTGWRIGWVVAPRETARSLTALQSHTTSNAATVSQHAALAALTRRDEAEAEIARMVGEFRTRRDAARQILVEAGVPHLVPEGAFYLFIDVSATARDGVSPGDAFARELLEESGVAIVPGSAFRTPEWVRVSYAAPIDHVTEGVRRLVQLYSRSKVG